MSRKQPNIESLTNELHEGSLFFQRQVNTPSPTDKIESFQAKSERMNETTNVPTIQRTNDSKPTRIVIRHTFDVFQDQLIRLQKLQIAAMTQGRRKTKLGKMVQKAIDLYLLREERKVDQT